MTVEEHTFDPPKPTPGAVSCGGQHHARARHEPDGTITWVCVDTVLADGTVVPSCGAERVTRDGQGWR
jgi:hypothetical protein